LDAQAVQEQANIKTEEVQERMVEGLTGRSLHLLMPELLPLGQLQITVAQEDLVVYVRLD
jgi:hypothetical protein